MPRSLQTALLLVLAVVLVTPVSAQAQDHSSDSTAYRSVRLDSSEIRRLPLSRSVEISSFLPGSALGLGYDAHLSGSVGGPDVRIDGVPALNLTFRHQSLTLPTFAVANVAASLAGSSAQFANLVSLHYTTEQGGTDRTAFANAATDAGMPGSLGNLRVAGGAGGPLGRLFRAAVNVSVQSADGTEFNNIGDVPVYAVEGIDTTVTYSLGSGNTRTVVIPNYVEIDRDRLPASGWNEQLATARIDFLPSPKVNAFVAGYYMRQQEREPFGGGCTPCATFNPASQRGSRTESSMITFGIDHMVGAHSSAHVRLSRASEETLSGVLTEGATGLFDRFSFLADDETYPLTDELVQRFLNNQGERTPFPINRNDLNGAVEFRMNPYGVRSTFVTRGAVNGRYGFADETRLFASAGLKTEVSSHKLSLGAELTKPEARYIDIGYNSTFTTGLWVEEPSVLSAFAEDVFHIGAMTIQAGVRYDSFDPNSEFPVTPGYVVPDDPSTVFDAPSSSAISPRVAVATQFGRVKMHGSFGQAAVLPSLSAQYAGKNIDIFRFGFTNANTTFGAPLEIYKVTSANLGGVVHATKALELEVNGFFNGVKDAPMTRLRPFDDPTNPGSQKYLRIFVNELDEELTGFDATAKYVLGSRSSARIGMSHETLKLVEDDPNLFFTPDSYTTTSIVGLMQFGSDRLPGNVDVTLALRAHSPESHAEVDGLAIGTTESSWLTRFDARISKQLNVAGRIRGSIHLDGLRLLGSSEYLDRFYDAQAIATFVEEHRQVLGNGQVNNNVNLTSLQTAGFGVLNEVDLHLLRQTEARFGNGDGMFSAAEQTAAFGAAAELRTQLGAPLGMSRRLVVGAQLTF